MSKLKLWKETSWEEAEANWEQGARQASQEYPVRGLNRLPAMPGMTADTARNLKWKSLKWMIQKDKGFKVLKGFLRHPIAYGISLVRSMLKGKSYKREGDFFLYGVDSVDNFQELLADKESLFVIGFSYCHKPFECPDERFTDRCRHDPDNPVCRQCFIGKAVNALPENAIPLLIPTIHYIGAKIFEIVHSNPGKQVLFIITACEMTLEMFGDWGNMVGIRGLGVRLDGRICNTMKAFELSEEGIKPGLTVVLSNTQKRIMQLIRLRRNS